MRRKLRRLLDEDDPIDKEILSLWKKKLLKLGISKIKGPKEE